MSLPIAFTMGDPAGVGPELIARIFRDHGVEAAGTVVFGDLGVMQAAAELVGGVRVTAVASAYDGVGDLVIPVVQSTAAPLKRPPVAEASAEGGRMAADSIGAALDACLAGRLRAMVTAPVHKEALAMAGVPYPGHTEMLQAGAARQRGLSADRLPVRMMLANEELRTVLVSIHLSLRDAIERVTRDRIEETIRMADASLRGMLGRDPRIAVAGLNPHAGEAGLFGHEEIEHIAPAVGAAAREGVQVSGPHPPDTVFMRARRGEFDVVIAMYHDQGLIPVKYLGVEHGVNVTLGLPFVRTSPDHGTAFDIAWRGEASEASLLAALRMARRLSGGPAQS